MYSQHRHNPTPAYVIILLCWSTSLAISLLIMFDSSNHANVWMIDFAKTIPVQDDLTLNHRSVRLTGYIITLSQGILE